MAVGAQKLGGSKGLTTQHVAVIVVTAALALTGVCVLVWMAAAGWRDSSGIIVGAIFVVLSLLQAAFAVLWWKSQTRLARQYAVQQEEEMLKKKESDLSAEKQTLVTDEVKLAFTDGAQKVDIEMVTIG